MKTENGCGFSTKPRAQLAFEKDMEEAEVEGAAMNIAEAEGKMEALEEEVSRLSLNERPSMFAFSEFQLELHDASMRLEQARGYYEHLTHGLRETLQVDDRILFARWVGRREGLGTALNIDNHCGVRTSYELRDDFQDARKKVDEFRFRTLTQASPRPGSRLWAPMTEVLKK